MPRQTRAPRRQNRAARPRPFSRSRRSGGDGSAQDELGNQVLRHQLAEGTRLGMASGQQTDRLDDWQSMLAPSTEEARAEPAFDWGAVDAQWFEAETDLAAEVGAGRKEPELEPGGGPRGDGETTPQWEMPTEDREFFERVLQIEPKDLADLTTGWYQSSEGNCVTVAIAKAAADALGTEVFTSIEKVANGLEIILRDGEKVELSTAELIQARGESAFRGKNETSLAYGTVIYAAAAKRALANKHQGARSYRAALASLNDGEYTRTVMGFLGLSDRIVEVDTDDLDGHDAVVASSSSHAIYVDLKGEEHIADHYGEAVDYNQTDTNSSGRGLFRRRNTNGIIDAFAIRKLADDERKKEKPSKP